VSLIAENFTMTWVVRRMRERARIEVVDMFAILTAVSLPWSTSLVAIFATAMLLSMVPFLELKSFLQSLTRPICIAPIALFALAVAGTLWSDADWSARVHAVGPTVKLLVLPVLLLHFERWPRGFWIFIAFLASCTCLMIISWIVFFYPDLSLKPTLEVSRGIFVKNYIDQSQEFALCAVGLAYPIVTYLRARRFLIAAVLMALSAGFLVNMVFVVVSRTAIVTVPVMLAVFGLLHLKWRANLAVFCATFVFGAVAWTASPQLEWTIKTFTRDYQLYKEYGESTSIGQRLEFWRKSLRFFAEAPVIGHGTGSTRRLFEQSVTGRAKLAAAEVIANPHNQTLNVAVQWGTAGIVLLYATWILHLSLFRGEGLLNWIGLLVVVQNIFTSLFNSHLFDFHEGWMYVLGVGVAGGMVLKAGQPKLIREPLASER
jgi:O-antigen ligase